MKKFTKICLITAAVFMVVGIGCTSAAWAMGVTFKDLPMITYRNSWNYWWNDWDRDWEEDFDDSWEKDLKQIPKDVREEVEEAMSDFNNEMDAYWKTPIEVIETMDFAGIKKLDVDIEVGGVQIIAVDADDTDGDIVSGGNIRVKVGDADSAEKYRVYIDDDGELCVETRWPKRKRYGNSLKRGRRIQILVPRGYQFNDVDLKVNAGALRADELQARSLDAKMNAGSMNIDNGTVEELDSEVNAGELVYQGSVSRDVDGQCNAGSLNLQLNGKKEDYNYEVKTAVGSVTIGDESYVSLNGKNIRNNGAGADMDLSCMAGSLTVTFSE